MLNISYFYFQLYCNKGKSNTSNRLWIERNVLAAQINKLHPLWWWRVRTRPSINNWKKSQQCPQRYWTRFSPCLVTCRSRCMGWNTWRPEISADIERTLQSQAFSGSVLGSETGINIQILEHTLPSKRSPNISRYIYFCDWRPAYAGDIIDRPETVGQ